MCITNSEVKMMTNHLLTTCHLQTSGKSIKQHVRKPTKNFLPVTRGATLCLRGSGSQEYK